MFCGQCGAAIELGAKFCEECGAVLGGVTLRQAVSFSRSLKSKSWTWLLLTVGSTLLLIIGGMLLTFRENGPGGKGNLSRKEAAQKIQAYYHSEAKRSDVEPINPYDYSQPESFLGRALHMLEDNGYLQYRLQGGKIEATLTEKGKLLLEKEILPWVGDVVRVHRADFRSGCEVNGITVDPGGVTAIVEFSVQVSDPYKMLRKVKGHEGADILEGKAQFRLYDDGWRVESIYIGR